MKKLIVAICIAFVAAGAAFSVKSVVDNSKENSFIKRNVEALGQTETGESCYDTIVNDDASYVKYCGTCTFIPGRGEGVKGQC